MNKRTEETERMWDDKTIGKAVMEAAYRIAEREVLPQVRFVRTHPDAKLPTKRHEGDAGWDVYAVEDTRVRHVPVLVPTGWKIAVPDGYEVQVRSRSGLAIQEGVLVLNSPGTVDATYRGSLGVILCCVDYNNFLDVKKGDRIAQLVVAPVTRAAMIEVTEFGDTTTRGEGAYGSTGR